MGNNRKTRAMLRYSLRCAQMDTKIFFIEQAIEQNCFDAGIWLKTTIFRGKTARMANESREKLFAVAISPKESDWKLQMGSSVEFYSHLKPPCARFSCSNCAPIAK